MNNEIPRSANMELPIEPVYKGEQKMLSEYTVDVLVVGGGYAGINAAYMAQKAGRKVLLVDKGRPGFSGQSAWPGSIHFVDTERDDLDSYWDRIEAESDGLGNFEWVRIFVEESKETFERLKSWGIMERYPRFADTEFFETNDAKGYRKKYVGSKDRRLCFTRMLDNNNIPWLQHVMINDVIVHDGRCVGAVGFQVTTGRLIRINAKAVVMACGNGVITSGSHCVGGNSFDGEYIAYNLGLKIGGKEYEDFHQNSSFATGNIWINCDTSYMDAVNLCGGWYSKEDAESFKKEDDEILHNLSTTEGLDFLNTYDKSYLKDKKNPDGSNLLSSKVYGVDPEEIRVGKTISPRFHADGEGGAIGMCLHLTSGVYSGTKEFNGRTDIPGLFCAGDGMQLTQPTGAVYALGYGSTCNFVSICGARAGRAAAEYSNMTAQGIISEADFEKARETIEEPLMVKQGFDPNWARDVLMGIMAPYWVSRHKSEATLKAALVNVEYMRDHVAPKLMARTPHGQKLCLEMKHKILASELKLRASLERKETRAVSFFRDDYPEKDESYTGYILLNKGADGTVQTSFVKVEQSGRKDEYRKS